MRDWFNKFHEQGMHKYVWMCIFILLFCLPQPGNSRNEDPLDKVLRISKEAKSNGDYLQSSTLLLEALDSIKSRSESITDLLRILISLTEANRSALRFDRALEYAYRGLRKANESHHQELTSWLYNRMGAVHFEMNQIDSARHYASASIAAYYSIENVPDEYQWILPSSALLNSALARSAKDYTEALGILEKLSEEITKDSSRMTELPLIYLNYAFTHNDMGNVENAIDYAKKGYELADQLNNPSMRRQHSGLLVDLYVKLEDYKNGMEWLGKMYQSVDEIHDAGKIKELELQLSQYEYRDKQQKNQLLEADLKEERTQNTIFGVVGLLFLILAIAVFLLYRKARQANSLLTHQKELIERQTKELMVLDEAKSRFFANVSHELKTPLSLILGPLNQMHSYETLPPSIRGNLDLAFNNTQRLQELVNEILNITKLDTNKLELKNKPLYLKKFVYRLFHSFKTLAEAKGQQLHIESTVTDELCIEIDRDKLEKVLSNLLSNAIKYSGEGSEIVFTIEYSAPQLTCRVADNGHGMTQEDAQHIFERFYQGNKKAREGGLGIGLSLSKEYALLMGGDLKVKSVPSQGTTFTFTARAEQQEGIDESSIEIIETTSLLEGIATHREAQVLLVEDNHEMRVFIKSLLVPYMKVVEAPNGKKALQLIQNRSFDLILSDVMMPEMDGMELLDAIKSDEKLKWLPIIMITAKGDIETKITALQEGVNDYVQKPFLASELLARVLNILNNARERKDAQKAVMATEVVEDLTDKARDIVIQNINNDVFDVPMLADELTMSERTLFRSLKSITGLTPNSFIKEIKLKYALNLLEREAYKTVNEVAEASGFKNRSTFTTLFTRRFGTKPSQYIHFN